MDSNENNQTENSKIEKPNWGILLALIVGFLLIILNPAFFLLELIDVLGIDLGDQNISQFITIIIFEVATIAVVYGFIKIRGNTLRAINMKWPKLKDLFNGAFAFIPYFILSVGVLIALQAIFPELNLDQEQELGFGELTSTLDLTLVYIALAIAVPISEELLFRGVLLQGFLKRTSPFIAIVITSALFGLAHFQLNVSIDTFIFGMFLGSLTIMTKNIWPAILLHSIKNSIAFAALYLF